MPRGRKPAKKYDHARTFAPLLSEPHTVTAERLLPKGADSRGRKLPPPTAPGELPDENSRLWLFIPESLRHGIDYVQDDTREWFAERDGLIPIGRSYPDHPRWIVAGRNPAIASMKNAKVISEIHILARVTAGLPEFPSWVREKMVVKQVQADAAYRLLAVARKSFVTGGQRAMDEARDRNPVAFLRIMTKLFSAAQLPAFDAEETIETDKLREIKALLDAEMKRREAGARVLAATPLDYDPAEPDVTPQAVLEEVAEELLVANGDKPANSPGAQASPKSRSSAARLQHVTEHSSVWDEFDE